LNFNINSVEPPHHRQGRTSAAEILHSRSCDTAIRTLDFLAGRLLSHI